MWARIRALTTILRSATLHELKTSTDIKGKIETKNTIISGGLRMDADMLSKAVQAHKPLKTDKSFENFSSNKSS